MAHPRLYWGEAGSVGVRSLVDLPLPFVFGPSGWGRSLHFLAAWWLVLPGAAWAGLIFILSFTRLWHRVEDKWAFFLGLWFALGMIIDVYFGVRARLRLLRDLRTVATQRFVPGRTIFFWSKPRRRPANPALPPAIVSET